MMAQTALEVNMAFQGGAITLSSLLTPIAVRRYSSSASVIFLADSSKSAVVDVENFEFLLLDDDDTGMCRVP